MLHGKRGLNWQVNVICQSYGKTYDGSWIIICHNPEEDGLFLWHASLLIERCNTDTCIHYPLIFKTKPGLGHIRNPQATIPREKALQGHGIIILRQDTQL